MPLREQKPLAGPVRRWWQCLEEGVVEAQIRKAAVGRGKDDRFDIVKKQNGQDLAMNQM